MFCQKINKFFRQLQAHRIILRNKPEQLCSIVSEVSYLMCPPVVEAVDHKFRRLGILSELEVYQSDRLGLNYNLIILRAKLTPLKVA